MSQRDKNDSYTSQQNHGIENNNQQNAQLKKIILVFASAIILASVVAAFIASGVTFLLLKNDYLVEKETVPSLTPSPSPTPTSTPSPPLLSEQPFPTSSPPPEEPDIDPQPTESPESKDEASPINNNELPGYFPDQGFQAPPSDLSRFKKASLLLDDMVVSGDRYIRFLKGSLLIRGKLYEPIFGLSGKSDERRVGFELDGSQQGLLLQFGLQDLESGDTNLTYLVRLSVDGELLWAGECKYGQNSQIISVPLSIPGAKTIVIEYYITEEGGFPSYNYPPLYFTKADLLYE
jgi:hypothetical protein